MIDTIYTIEKEGDSERGRFTALKVEDPAKVDGHCHSKFSGIKPDLFISSWWTRMTGVRESYTSPAKLYKVTKKRGMTFPTISDHDSVFGCIELRKKHPDDTLVNCEYSVRVSRANPELAIHVGVWGLDYPDGQRTPLSDREVLRLHNELMRRRNGGYEQFIRFCEKEGISYAFNHPAWHASKHYRMTGEILDELTDAFPVLEINGDYQLENFIALFIAQEKNKPICGGSDAHPYIRLGNQYTATKYHVETPFEFMEAFRKRDIGIGTNMKVSETDHSIEEVLKKGFNGKWKLLLKDTGQGYIDYTLKDWKPRKYLTLAAVSTPIVASLLPYDWIAWLTVPTTIMFEAAALWAIPRMIVMQEKHGMKKKAHRLLDEYLDVQVEKATSAQRTKIHDLQDEIEDIREKYKDIKLPSMFSAFEGMDERLFKMSERVPWFKTDFDMATALEGTDDDEELESLLTAANDK